MVTILFTVVVSGIIVALAPPAKVTDVETNSSEMHAVKRPTVIHVRSFSVTNDSKSTNGLGEDRPHLLGTLRGGEENTAMGEHRGTIQ